MLLLGAMRGVVSQVRLDHLLLFRRRVSGWELTAGRTIHVVKEIGGIRK